MMKRLGPAFIVVFLCASPPLSAETEEEEMQRLQQQLNDQVFGTQREKPPAPPPAAAPAPAPEPVTQAAPPPEPEGLPVTVFTGYQLAGVRLGMAEAAVYARFKEQGYVCRSGAASQMARLAGKIFCIYPSSEAPKVAMIGFAGGVLRDIEVHETYKTGFPKEIYKQAKSKFMRSYGAQAKCKTRRRGEICEVFGHGYRIVLRYETEDDGAKIVRRVGRL